MKWIYLCLVLCGCGNIEYSPWQSNPPNDNLTAKHLARLAAQENISDKSFKVAIVGDPQAVVGSLDKAVGIINARDDIDFTLLVGDLTDRGMMQEFVWIDRVVAKLEKPILTVVGNHDGLNNGKKIYEHMFGPFDYSFVYQDVKFVMWNNNAYEWRVNMDWLEQEVNSYHRIIIVAHQPPGDGALTNEEERRWKDIRRSPNVIASIHGHVHRFDFQKEEGLPIYTVDRVLDAHYGVLSVADDKLIFENCSPICKAVGGGP